MPRKTPEEALQDLEKKEAQLKARISKQRAKVRSADRKRDTRRKIIAGALALEHADKDPKFGEALKRLLEQHVTRPQDRQLFDL
jgi:hypothetical protein